VKGGLGTPSGNVTFYDGDPNAGGTAIGSAPVDGQGDAIDEVTALHVTDSPHSIFAVYSPDSASDYASSTTTTPASVSVSPAPLKITANDASKVFGAALPFVTVSFSGFVNGDNAASLTTPPIVTTSATPTSPVGNYVINVSGDASNDYTFTYVPGTLAITKASTNASLSGSETTSLFGQSVSFSVHVAPVSPGAGNPVGLVSLLIDGATINTVTLDAASSQASFSINSIGPGTHSIMATYSGGPNFEPSQSSSRRLLVLSASTHPILTAQAFRNKKGQIVSVNLQSQVVVLLPGTGVPLGTVTYLRNGQTLKIRNLANGTAVVKLKANQALNKSFTIEYSGDPNYNPSASAALFVTKKVLKMSARPTTAFFMAAVHRRHHFAN
jgi:hypothetical protein